MDGAAVAALWKSNARTVQAIDFGNTYRGLYYESHDRSYIAIRDAAPVASQPPQAVENGVTQSQSINRLSKGTHRKGFASAMLSLP